MLHRLPAAFEAPSGCRGRHRNRNCRTGGRWPGYLRGSGSHDCQTPATAEKNRGTSAWPVIWHPMVDPPTFYSGAHKARTKMIVAWALSLRSVCNSICPKCFWRSCFFSENLWSVHASLVPQMCKTTESSHVHTQTAVGDKMLVGLPMPWAARKFLSCRQC